MRTMMEYVRAAETVDEAIEMVRSDARNEVMDWLDDLDSDEVYDILSQINSDIAQMEELDNDFRHLSVTEILEQLRNIDTSDAYYNRDTLESGDYLWDVADEDIDDIADRIHNGDIELRGYYELDLILDEEETLISGIEAKFEQYEQTRKLFEMMMKDDPEETMTILWNGR